MLQEDEGFEIWSRWQGFHFGIFEGGVWWGWPFLIEYFIDWIVLIEYYFLDIIFFGSISIY